MIESSTRDRSGRAAVIALAGVIACAITWWIARSWPAPPVERATLASVALVPLWSGLALAGLCVRRGARPGHARRSLFALHRRLGGALAVVAMLVFGSGVAAVLDRALASWQLRADQLREPPPPSEQALDEALAELLRLHPELGQGELALHGLALDVEVGEEAAEPLRHPPGAGAEQGHHGGHEGHAHEE
ncbi:MAG TPA: hypothetical protein VK034_09825, partial [Enhygromyxa sp.]|nr:hypothetical protein [Enhygromyxa sp.]